MMLYFVPVSDDEKNAETIKELFKCLSRNFWDKNIAHHDIAWRNIGWYETYEVNPEGKESLSKRELVLFDLAMCKTYSNADEAYDADTADRYGNSTGIVGLFKNNNLKYNSNNNNNNNNNNRSRNKKK